MVSLVSQTPDGDSVEVGIVGFEGIVSIYAILGADKSTHKMLVQIPDAAMRLPVEALRDEFKRAGTHTISYCVTLRSCCYRPHRLPSVMPSTWSQSGWRGASC